jgi:hypothetical protein
LKFYVYKDKLNKQNSINYCFKFKEKMNYLDNPIVEFIKENTHFLPDIQKKRYYIIHTYLYFLKWNDFPVTPHKVNQEYIDMISSAKKLAEDKTDPGQLHKELEDLKSMITATITTTQAARKRKREWS